MRNRLRSKWPLLFSLIVILLLISYYFYRQSPEPAERMTYKIVYGILGMASLVFLFLYIIRKNTYCCKLGATQSWLQAHMYFGIISLVLIFMHSSFNITGIFNVFFLALYHLVFISGIVGSILYSVIPLSLTKYGRDMKSEAEIIGGIENFLVKADNLVSNTSDPFKDIYEKNIRPFLKSRRTKWEYLFSEEKELINKFRKMMEGYKDKVPSQDIYDLDILGSLLIEKEKLSFMWAKTKILKTWLSFHLPLTAALLTAAGAHIWSILYF